MLLSAAHEKLVIFYVRTQPSTTRRVFSELYEWDAMHVVVCADNASALSAKRK